MHFTEDQIWAPLVNINSKHNFYDLRVKHIVYPSGRVSYTGVGRIEHSCQLDMTYFPYDIQTCSFSFSTLEEDQASACISPAPAIGKLNGFIENGDWEVLDVYATSSVIGGYTSGFCCVYVNIKLKRRPTYYTLNLFLPVVTISLLGQLTFMVPVESGERLAYSLTVLLSQSVYATSVSSLMPRSSLTTPVIIRYMQALFLISSLSIFINLLIISLRWGKIVCIGENKKIFHIFGIPFTVSTASARVGKANRIGIDESIKSSEIQFQKNTGFHYSSSPIDTTFQVCVDIICTWCICS